MLLAAEKVVVGAVSDHHNGGTHFPPSVRSDCECGIHPICVVKLPFVCYFRQVNYSDLGWKANFPQN